MQVVVLQENLKAGLSKVGHAVAGKSTLPVLSNVLLSTDEGRLKLAATNLEIGITCHIGAKVEDEGAVTIPARLFADVVSGLPNERVMLTLDERTQTVRIECGRVVSNIKGVEAEEFPVIPTGGGNLTIATLPADLVKRITSQVAIAAATDDTRPVLAAVLFRFTGRQAVFACADGFRLAVLRADVEESIDNDGKPVEYLIPARAVEQLSRLAGDGDVVMTATPNANQVIFTGDSWQMTTRLVEGKFPDFKRIVPASHETRSVVDVARFTQAVKLASHFAKNAAGIIKLDMESSELTPGKLTISANAAEVGDNKSVIDDIAVAGKSGQIALKDEFLADALAACGGEMVAMETATPQSPAVFKRVGDDSYLHVVMPMAIRP